MRQKVEASAIRDGSRMPLEAPGNRGRGIPGTPGPWTLQWEEVEQGWCQSQDLVVQRLHESAEEEECQVKAFGFASQVRWMQWDQAQERPLSWKELWQIDQGRLSFLLRLLTDRLPTPRNIKIWGGEEDPSWNQFGAVFCTLNHILTGCPKALAEGRYRWRHDKFLIEIAKWVEQQRVKANNKQAHPPEAITFVRKGDKAHKTLIKSLLRLKRTYKNKVEEHFNNNNPRSMWQGINNITGFKGSKPATVNIAASLPDELNTFYARFEADNTAHTESAAAAAAEEVSPLTLSVADVTRSFKRVNIRKAVGPDGIPGRVLKACAFQLAGVFTDIFNLSLSLSVVPSCFKKSIIVPIPKKNKITCLNDWRPVALTPIFSKCFEKLVRDYICSVLPASLDPLQFAYRSNRSTDDAIAFTLHTALSHLENKNTYVRMLFVDYSSAFNTIVPATLVVKLQTLGLNRSLCSWILDFLTGRSQVVRMGNNTSSPLILNTGAPQGCVLSPLLYSLYTHDCTATHSSNVIVKFADDTTVIGLITDNDETAYREEVSTLTKWCQENHLSLNIDKTKELVVDYRRQSREHTPITIDKTPVERVTSFKFLGVHITEDLTWSAHTDAVLKKAHQRLFFLRRLRKFGTSPRILRSFYTCTVESILTGCITAWYGNSTAGNRRALQRVVRTARHIVGGELPSLQDIYTRRCTRKARRIIKDSSHPSHRLLSLLPSGRRFRSIRSRTSRLRDSFFPQAIRLMNSHK